MRYQPRVDKGFMLHSCRVRACALRTPFTARSLNAIKKRQSRGQDCASQRNVEVTGGARDMLLHGSLGDVSRNASLSECWHPSSGLDELKAAASPRQTWPEPDTVWC